jgi:hypothetical protein
VVEVLTVLQVFEGGLMVEKSSIGPSGPSPSPPGGITTGSPAPGGRITGMMMCVSALELSE